MRVGTHRTRSCYSMDLYRRAPTVSLHLSGRLVARGTCSPRSVLRLPTPRRRISATSPHAYSTIDSHPDTKTHFAELRGRVYQTDHPKTSSGEPDTAMTRRGEKPPESGFVALILPSIMMAWLDWDPFGKHRFNNHGVPLCARASDRLHVLEELTLARKSRSQLLNNLSTVASSHT